MMSEPNCFEVVVIVVNIFVTVLIVVVLDLDLDLYNFSTNCTRICSKDKVVLSRSFSLTLIQKLNPYSCDM